MRSVSVLRDATVPAFTPTPGRLCGRTVCAVTWSNLELTLGWPRVRSPKEAPWQPRTAELRTLTFSSDDKHKHECEHYILNTRANQRTNLDLLRPHAMRTCLHLLPPTIVSLLTPTCIPSNFLHLPPEQ